MGRFDQRSSEEEIIDDFSLDTPELAVTLKSIERINTWLGGHRVLLDSLESALADKSVLGREGGDRVPGDREPGDRRRRPAASGPPLMIYDLGCGSGDGLRAISEWAKRNGRAVELVGIDANPFVVEQARERSAGFDDISYRVEDILSPDFRPSGADVVAFNLCLHHFTNTEIVDLLDRCREARVQAVLVNDLHRSALAHALFPLVCWVLRSPPMARTDGLLSIRKGFRRAELCELAERAGVRDPLVRWRWAFRYQATFRWDSPALR